MNRSLIIQSDNTIILLTTDLMFNFVKDELIKFAEIKQSPDSVYFYEITQLSIWNAVAIGITREEVINLLKDHSKFPIPAKVIKHIHRCFDSYGIVTLERHDQDSFYLEVLDESLRLKMKASNVISKLLCEEKEKGFTIRNNHRGEIKSVLMKNNISVEDKVGYSSGEELLFSMREKHKTEGFDIKTRYYQEESCAAVHSAGNGTVVLPCGSGKTMVGLRFAELCQTTTLIITNSSTSVKQWRQAFLNFTSLAEDQISCYTSDNKVFAPVTICTYSMIAYKYKGEFIHFNKFIQKNWGSLILDEVHLMPANMFRIVASFQSTKRLALTATFVREDGRERDIFTLVGPKRYDKPWKDLEAQGYIASINLKELRVPLSESDKKKYLEATSYQEKINIAVMSQNKTEVIKKLLEKHKDDKILIIGQFTEQITMLSKQLGIPMVKGSHSLKEREYYYDKMRSDGINTLIASSIANAALDIPGISVVIQISFQGGSRSEESQRVGRAMRPKDKPAYFYTLVSKDTVEESQNYNRQRFLTNEGYQYEIQEMVMAA